MKHMTMNASWKLIGLCIAGSLMACTAQTSEDEGQIGDGSTENVEGNEWQFQELSETETEQIAEASATDPGVPPGEDGVVDKAGCSYIQWCNEPGYWGTVCIWTSCSLSAAARECTVDANYVCGGITQPAVIR